MNLSLEQTMQDLVIPGRGILAADESTGTIGKRFASINLENTAENRQTYRGLLATTPQLAEAISGVILFEETLTQTTADGRSIVAVFQDAGIVPGIKVDKGLIPFATHPQEKITQGLDGLAERLKTYQEHGARFAKWRNVYTIGKNTPSHALINSNAELLARYAAICQAQTVVPIVEPEVLMDGPHTIQQCADVTGRVLQAVFEALYRHQVNLEHILLKPNMVLPGNACPDQSTASTIGALTRKTLKRHVPSAVTSINFLSGGQTPVQATSHLQSINSRGNRPWAASFSYGRALQEPCLQAWQGLEENTEKAQKALLNRARLNAAASLGQYTGE